MTEDVQQQLKIIEYGTREEIWEAAKKLSCLATEMVSALVALLTKAEQPEARAAAAYVLGSARYASARTSLEEVLNERREDVSVRGHAAEALAYIRDRASVSVLLNNLGERDPAIRYWCIFALGQIGDSSAVSALKEVVESVGDESYETYSIRAEALDAIAEIEQRTRDIAPE